MFGRRLLILVAVLMGLTALAASIAPPPDRTRERPAPESRPPRATEPAPTPSAAPETGVLSRRVDARRRHQPVRIEVPLDRTLRLTVVVGGPDSVALGDLQIDAADPASPAMFELLADTPGRYPLRLIGADRMLGVVRVSD